MLKTYLEQNQTYRNSIVGLPLYDIAGEKFEGYKPTKVVNEENAEIDDISVVRDGDHLYLLHNDYNNMNITCTF